MQNPWQGLVWWVDGGLNGNTVFRIRPYNRGNLRDMVHNCTVYIHLFIYNSNSLIMGQPIKTTKSG